LSDQGTCGESAFIATTPQAIAKLDGENWSGAVKFCSSAGQDRQPFDHRHCLGVVVPLLCGGATIGHSGLAEAQCRRRRRANRGSDIAGGRELYFQKVRAGVVRNPCYFAMDATRPHEVSDGKLGPRFYVICESGRSFRAISAGHGGGRNLKGIADFANGKRCAKNFGNALDSRLTAGGAYVTAETKTSFKGYYRASAKQDAVLIRSFVRFDGEGEVANVRHWLLVFALRTIVVKIRSRPKRPKLVSEPTDFGVLYFQIPQMMLSRGSADLPFP
jgi:hypothetical protein